jgi:hypothetical protein
MLSPDKQTAGLADRKVAITTLMMREPKSHFTYAGTSLAGREHSNESLRDGYANEEIQDRCSGRLPERGA